MIPRIVLGELAFRDSFLVECFVRDAAIRLNENVTPAQTEAAPPRRRKGVIQIIKKQRKFDRELELVLVKASRLYRELVVDKKAVRNLLGQTRVVIADYEISFHVPVTVLVQRRAQAPAQVYRGVRLDELVLGSRDDKEAVAVPILLVAEGGIERQIADSLLRVSGRHIPVAIRKELRFQHHVVLGQHDTTVAVRHAEHGSRSRLQVHHRVQKDIAALAEGDEVHRLFDDAVVHRIVDGLRDRVDRHVEYRLEDMDEGPGQKVLPVDS